MNEKQTTPLMHFISLCRHLLMHLSKMHKLDFEGELEAIYMGTQYAKNHLSSSNNNLHIYTDS